MAVPYSPRELAARRRAVLRRGRNERALGVRRPTEARFDGWVVDSSRREVLAPDGAQVDLTAAEFALLPVLLDHPPVVIARPRLMELGAVRDAPSSARRVAVLVRRPLSTPTPGGTPP